MTEARILLVDGDPQGSGGYQAQLEADGFAVYQADTLRAAWFAVEEILPDLILLDVTLPDGSGLDFCQALRAAIVCRCSSSRARPTRKWTPSCWAGTTTS